MNDDTRPAPVVDAVPRPARVARMTWIVVGVTALLVLIVLLFGYGFEILLTIFAGILLAVLLRSLADALHRLTGLPTGWSLAAVIVLLVGLAVLVGMLLAPRIADQAAALSDQLPKAIEHLGQQLKQYHWGAVVYRWMEGALHQTASPGNVMTRARGLVSSFFGVVLTVIVIIFVGLYVATEPSLYVRGVLHMVPRRHRAQAQSILDELGHVLRWWLVGQAIDMTFVGVLTGVGLWLIGVPLAATLGVIAGLFNFIPNFGPLFSLVPAGLLALAERPRMALYVLGLYVVVQSVEGYILQPMIQRRAVSLAPALTLTIQVLMGLLIGPMGLMLATPLTAVALVLVKRLYVEDALGDDLTAPAGVHVSSTDS